MNMVENLMIIAMEEAAELQQDISKAMRFGMNEYCVEYGHTVDNEQRILTEYYQLQAVMEHLQTINILKTPSEEEIKAIKDKKIEKVYKYMQVSKQKGTLK